VSEALTAGATDVEVSAHMPAPATQQPVKLRNVIGVLRGSDPALKDTYLVLTAHYDHLGVRGTGEGDHIYNGANDDASGTSSVLEIAKALASLSQRPRRKHRVPDRVWRGTGRSGLALLLPAPRISAGEDRRQHQPGATWPHGRHEGPRLLQFNLTGFDYTDIAAFLSKAGEKTGIRVVKDKKNSESFFRAQRQRRLCRRWHSFNHAFGQLHFPGLSPPRRRVAQARLRQHGQSGRRGGVGRLRHRRQRRSSAVEQG